MRSACRDQSAAIWVVRCEGAGRYLITEPALSARIHTGEVRDPQQAERNAWMPGTNGRQCRLGCGGKARINAAPTMPRRAAHRARPPAAQSSQWEMETLGARSARTVMLVKRSGA